MTVSDTATILMQTEFQGKVRGDDLPYNLLGTFSDPVFGKTTTLLYTQLRRPVTAPKFKVSSKFDSLVLSIRFSDVIAHIGDLNYNQTFKVYQLGQSLNEDSLYYADTVISHEPVLLGIYTGPLLSKDSVLRIHLNDVLAKKFFQADSNVFNSPDAFNDFVKGLAIIPDSTGFTPGKGAIAPFDLWAGKSNLVLYHDDSLFYSMRFDQEIERISAYRHDYRGTLPLQHVQNPGTYPQVYVQGMGGFKVKIMLPYLKEYVKGGAVGLHKAEFIFPQAESTGDPYADNVPRVLLFRPLDSLEKDVSSLDESIAKLKYSVDGSWNAANREYRVLLTREMQYVFSAYKENSSFKDYGYVLSTPSRGKIAFWGGAPIGSSVYPGRVILNTQGAGAQKPRLILTFTKLVKQ